MNAHTGGHRPFTLRGWTVLIIALTLFSLLLSSTAATIAQDDTPPGDGDSGTEPPRGIEREAPAREPVILETEMLEDGAIRSVIELPPVADTYIASERPFQNYGSDALFLGYNTGIDNFGAERILIRFDIANNIPAASVINDATLRLHLSFASPGNDTAMPTALRRLASPWNENEVTWNSEPTWAEVRANTDVGTTLTWYEWEITDLVADWVDGAFANNGMEIIGDEMVQQRERVFYSRETATQFYPRLVVDYTETGDTEPPVITVDPLPQYSSRNFTVTWSGSDQGTAGIAYYDVQYRIDGGAWVDWLNAVTYTTSEFPGGEDGRLYQFRARGVDNANNVEPFLDVEAETIVDAVPPTTTVNPLPALTENTSFTISWSGDDGDGSGIAYYDVQYRYNGGVWTLWQQQTVSTSAIFTAMNDGFYEFEARAADNFGRVEAFQNNPEASIAVDAQAPFITPQLWLPVVITDTSN